MSFFNTRALKLARILQVPIWRNSFCLYGVAASVHREPVLRLLCSLDLIVDIGANRGQFSLLSRYYNHTARIIAFEPQLSPAETYRRVFARDKDTLLFGSAIGPAQGDLTMYISARDHSSSLLPISNLQSQTFPGTSAAGTTTVAVAPLSSFLAPVDIVNQSLLKIDVQGFEYYALQGCESLLDSFTYILCECSFVELYTNQRLAPDVISWLAARGFLLKGIYNVYYNSDRLAIQADLLFGR